MSSLFAIPFLKKYSTVWPDCLNFWLITAKFSGVRKFRNFTVSYCFQCNVDLSFSHDVPVTFKLVEGSGPVCLAGQHLIGR